LLLLQASEKHLKDDPSVDSYTYDLSKVLKHVKPQEKYQYVFGFMNACGKKYVRTKKYQTNSRDLFLKSYKHIGPRTTANILAYFNKQKGKDCHDPKSGFEAYAIGNLDPLNPARLDVWKIDQDKRIEHVVDGLPLP